ncbi:alpha/beta hydrolase [Gimesia maris]|uniref:Carboxylesterase NlhH n=1 Tax=Gimesia maris TaxID=122 RepID=A0ABX5YZJ1_9PLAN|nr:alpha/beta hydrolase [Gimesia maris]QEG19959.1 Carboxylesterase NlhH [Gimesia maris]QGQ27239.1 alpha/beta hydrolase [Gimesia maris]|tara:strand:+ start:165119 stop:166060 length:942 start_codon:yes stop_codon:yes gene_type:complete
MPVHPQVAQYLEEISKVDLPPFEEMTPEFIRSTLTPSPEPHIPSQSIENRSIPVNGTKIPIRIYTPPEAIMINAEEMPALVFFHGGGWVMGTLDAYDGVCQDLAGTSGCKVISVDYRMAPEFPYPIPFDDSYSATEWISVHARELGIDRHQIAVGGDSAGGNLATAVALKARHSESLNLVYQLLVYPVTNYQFDTESYQSFGTNYFLTKRAMEWFWDQYLPDESSGREIYASPLRCKDLAGMPDTLVITAGYDPLYSEAVQYIEMLRKSDVIVEHLNYEDMIHGFFRRSDLYDRAYEAVQAAGQKIKQRYSRM